MNDIEYCETQRSLPIIVSQLASLQISRPRHTVSLDNVTDNETAREIKSWPRRIFLWTFFVALLLVCLSFYVNGRLDLESVLEAMKTPRGSVVLTGILTSSVLFL